MRPRLLLTQSLLSAWQWTLKTGDLASFRRTLRREPGRQTTAMREGVRFENVLQAVLQGAKLPPDHEWAGPIRTIQAIFRQDLEGSPDAPPPRGADAVRPAAAKSGHSPPPQVRLSRAMTVEGVPFLLYGVLDFLQAGVIYDTKLSRRYRPGSYHDSPQHPFYFALCPEAYAFSYLVCDGAEVFREDYRPEDCEPVARIVSRMLDWLDRAGLAELYSRHWVARG